MGWEEGWIPLFVAFVAGAAIGLERQWRQRMAGLRTNVLVSLGAALYVLLSVMVVDEVSSTRVAAQVVSGIGFLGAGVIIRDGFSVRGLNTAATLWCAGAVGTLSGAGFYWQAMSGAGIIILANVILRPIAFKMNSRSGPTDSEADYLVSTTCLERDEVHIRVMLMHMVNARSVGLRKLYSEDIEGTEKVVVKAHLHSSERKDTVIEEIVGLLSLETGITAVGWSKCNETRYELG
ncbi:MgtC/SapB family protein [Desmospora profundinema]|uniref:Mg2+ transporter-C (MgtC) family protein n=1 Tax=Desmospora profundinema TaxID=1571184 RepID=A0ABU1IRX5_9BACL|nr:MgtC/SapB family protein [Desmospora profundinema]MDR6227483.1 putative Mg2+ transporter-C (MgtC) family protein [Desmospora profundinema]